jgi:GNAT superfamily N-acetyltransferase
MTTITLPMKASEHPNIRAVNVLRDLSTVADLIELCFSNTMDNDGQRYVNDMRRAGRDEGFLRWANHMAETTSLPLTGYVWEENKKIVGNASLIPFRDKGKRVHLIANVAVHPDHRRRGIARALTERTIQHAREKNTTAIWIHVRDDNPGALKLYSDLGFQEVARRTSWITNPDSLHPVADSDIQIVSRHPRFWPHQQDWLRRLYPEALAWYHSWNFNTLKPGFWNWLVSTFSDYETRQWAAVRGETLLATLTLMSHGARSESLYAATPGRVAVSAPRPASGEDEARALTQLLLRARRALSHHSKLYLDFPGGEMTEAIQAAGFKLRRTLIWMRV